MIKKITLCSESWCSYCKIPEPVAADDLSTWHERWVENRQPSMYKASRSVFTKYACFNLKCYLELSKYARQIEIVWNS